MKKNNLATASVLLLGANNQAMLMVARQLSLMGYAIDVADWQNLPVKHAGCLRNYFVLSDILVNTDTFVDDLIKIIEKSAYLFMLPVNDAALEVCIKYRAQLNCYIKMLAVPDDDIYTFAHNKYTLLKKCMELNIPVPQFHYIDNPALAEDLIPQLSFPVIAKPVHSKLIKNNKLYQFNVKKIFSPEELIDFLREHVLNVPVMIQEMVGGVGAGFNVIANKGSIIAAYQHQRISEPVGGGASGYRQTVPVNQHSLKDLSVKLLHAIKWSGPAMIEYKVCNGVPFVMELNGRFWGSLSLGIKAGLNYPAILVDLFVKNKELPYTESSKIVFSRNLKMDGRFAITKTLYYKSPRYFFSFLFSLFRCFKKNEMIEDSIFIDFKLECATYVYLIKKLFLWLFEKTKLLLPVKSKKPLLKEGMNIAFVCYGNICRSPFAEVYAKKHYAGRFNFYSYGLNKQDNRLVPANALSAAHFFNVSLDNHVSRYIPYDIIHTMDIIFVMDKNNYNQLNKAFPALHNKIYFLGGKYSIKDPFSKSVEVFADKYKQIITILDELFSVNIESDSQIK